MRLSRIATAFAAAGLVAGGCRSAVAPQLPGATYILLTIDGRPLPTAFSPADPHASPVVREILFLDGAGRATRSTGFQESGATALTYVTTTYSYAMKGDSLVLGTSACGPADICVAPEAGVVGGDTLTLTTVGDVAAPVRRYRLEPLIG